MEKIQTAGGIVASSVSRKPNWVLAGEGSGAKFISAHSLGITIIDEVEFLGMLSEEGD